MVESSARAAARRIVEQVLADHAARAEVERSNALREAGPPEQTEPPVAGPDPMAPVAVQEPVFATPEPDPDPPSEQAPAESAREPAPIADRFEDPAEPSASWREPAAPRSRTGRWLLATILGAIGLALLLPLAIGALRDLVALS